MVKAIPLFNEIIDGYKFSNEIEKNYPQWLLDRLSIAKNKKGELAYPFKEEKIKHYNKELKISNKIGGKKKNGYKAN